jgi:hypothetical protein
VIRLMLRAIANLLLAAAVATAVIDAYRSLERAKLVLTPFAQAPTLLLAMQPGSFESFIKTHVPGFLWNPVAVTLLGLPAFLVLAAMAAALFRLARRRRRRLELQPT